MPAPNFQYSLTPATDQKSLAVRDLTSNWYSPQPDPSEVTSAVFNLYIPDTTTYNVSSNVISVNILSKGFPVVSDIVITNTDLGITGSLPDGLYESEIVLIYLSDAAGAGTVSYTVNFYLIGGVMCCIGKSTSESCNCNSKKKMSIYEANITLLSIPYACSADIQAALILASSEYCAQKFCKGCQ